MQRSGRRSGRCCEMSGALTDAAQDLGEILKDCTIYRCKSSTCSDNGGVCHLIVPCFFEAPKDCTNRESFTDNEEEPDCEWEEI